MKHIYATFADPNMAERAGGALIDHGVAPEHISIVFPENYKATVLSDYRSDARNGVMEGKDAEDVAKSGLTTTTSGDATSGAAKGAGIGLAAGTAAALASVFIPGVGLVLGGGALALAIAGMAGTTAAGAVAGGVTGYLKDQGVPAEDIEFHEKIVVGGGAMLTVTPSFEEYDNVAIESILKKYQGNVSSYEPPKTALVDQPTHTTVGR